MKIIVCIKQVPEADKVAVNPETGTLIREGVASILNPFCQYALDEALRLKSMLSEVKVIAITMGPPQAKAVLLTCLELGADEAYLLSDRKFAGADCWATSKTLKEGIKRVAPDYDLIITGKQAIDGDTAQVPAELAEGLGIPQITYGIEITVENKKIQVKRETEKGFQIIESRLPSLVTISKGSNIRRLPSMADILNSRKKPYKVVPASELALSEEQLGLKGSPTQVARIFAPPSRSGGKMIKCDDAGKNASELITFLIEKKFIARDN